MRGLIYKDICLLSKQKKLAIIYVFVAVMLSFSMDATFIVSYFSMIGALLVLTTLSYDAFDNGYPFLMSLPVDAKTYIMAKYTFSFLGLAVFWIVAMGIELITLVARGISFDLWDMISMNLALFPAFLLIIALMIPVTLKFGTEKCRVILVVIAGVVVLIALLGKKITEYLAKNSQIDLEGILLKLESLSKGAIIISALIVSILLLLLSMLISTKIMQKKEY